MAHLRGDSTVGGKPIVTLDVMNTFVEQIQGVGLKAKINKYEEDKLSSLSDADTIIVDKEMNGFWQVDGTSTYNGMHPQGQLANLSNTIAKFQMYAPVREGSSSALYFRTGEGSTIRPWERVVTNSILTEQLKTKIDSSNGIANNLTINDQLKITNDVFLGELNWFKTGFFLGTTAADSNSSAIYPTESNGIFLQVGNNKGLDIEQSLMLFNGKEVYHEGNFDLNKYVERSPKILIPGYDVGIAKGTGYYVCNNPSNVPDSMTGLVFIEVINYADNFYILQKIYSTNGKYSYYRTFSNNTWTDWVSLVGPLSYVKNITSSNWSKNGDTYEMTITHNLGSENITSVIVTDSDKISMFTGFQIISSTVIKVFSATNPSGKIAINAIQ